MRIYGLRPRFYYYYRFLNSLFAGLSIGSIFTIYSPLEPSIYSIGGILLALGMLIVAKFYERLMNFFIFFIVCMFIEFVILILIVFFLGHPYNYLTALLIYGGYQITFIFGSYIVRTETLFLKRKKLLSWLDIYKQSGYLIGLVFSFLFYKMLEIFFDINTNQEKVYLLHYVLIFVQCLIIIVLFRSFKMRI